MEAGMRQIHHLASSSDRYVGGPVITDAGAFLSDCARPLETRFRAFDDQPAAPARRPGPRIRAAALPPKKSEPFAKPSEVNDFIPLNG